jgi:uncharacterized repeat protein (TIGR03806 family)
MMQDRLSRTTLLATLTLALAHCSNGPSGGTGGHAPTEPTPAPADSPYDTLDAWHLFADARAQTPNGGVTPYEVAAPLFSDYTTKYRFLWVPPGKKIAWKDTDRWDVPEGSIFVKTFAYPTDARDPSKGQRILETRLLVRGDAATGWVPHTYVWDAAQTKAVREVAGDTIDVSWIDAQGATQHNAYGVPNTNVCKQCHGETGITGPLGGRTRQLNRDHDYGNGPENEIDHLASLGLFDVAPPAKDTRQTLVDPFGTGPSSDRGRAYLDANCSHCHGVVGLAKGTAFWLDYDHTDPATGNPTDYGVCKVPASAGGGTCGLGFDVVPGHSDQSIVPCRVGSTVPEEAMPPVGHKLIHAEGVALLKEWIDALPGKTCQ